jgi:hypothetical protein
MTELWVVVETDTACFPLRAFAGAAPDTFTVPDPVSKTLHDPAEPKSTGRAEQLLRIVTNAKVVRTEAKIRVLVLRFIEDLPLGYIK